MGLSGLCNAGEGFLVDAARSPRVSGLPAPRLAGDRSRRAPGDACCGSAPEVTTASSSSPMTLTSGTAVDPAPLAARVFRAAGTLRLAVDPSFFLGADASFFTAPSAEEPLVPAGLLLPAAVRGRLVPFLVRAAGFLALLPALPTAPPFDEGSAGLMSPGEPRSRFRPLFLDNHSGLDR